MMSENLFFSLTEIFISLRKLRDNKYSKLSEHGKKKKKNQNKDDNNCFAFGLIAFIDHYAL